MEGGEEEICDVGCKVEGGDIEFVKEQRVMDEEEALQGVGGDDGRGDNGGEHSRADGAE